MVPVCSTANYQDNHQLTEIHADSSPKSLSRLSRECWKVNKDGFGSSIWWPKVSLFDNRLCLSDGRRTQSPARYCSPDFSEISSTNAARGEATAADTNFYSAPDDAAFIKDSPIVSVNYP